MNILLVNPTIRANDLPYNFPAGLGIIAAVMQEAGYGVTVYDQNALRTSNRTLLQNLKGRKFDVIGLGGLITTYGHVKKVLPGLREMFPKAKIVLGGGLTVDPSVIFRHLPADVCVHGEGEHIFRDLCAIIDAGRENFAEVPGISFVRDGKMHRTPPRGIETDLDRFPMPAYTLFPSEIYFQNNLLKHQFRFRTEARRCATLLWSRGCPNQCTFCWRMMGKTLRFRSMDRVMEEIAFLRSQYGVDSYLFFDECINSSTKRSLAFADRLLAEGFDAPWYSHARVSNFTPELAAAFRRSGCVGLNFGIESGNRRMLQEMKKRATPEQAAEAVRIAMENEIRPMCTFIVGMPGETEASVMDSAHWIQNNRIGHYAFFFATPYPGCELYERPAVQQRIRDKFQDRDRFFEALGDAKDLVVNMTDFSDAELTRLKKKAEGRSLVRRVFRLAMEPYRWKRVLKNLAAKLFTHV